MEEEKHTATSSSSSVLQKDLLLTKRFSDIPQTRDSKATDPYRSGPNYNMIRSNSQPIAQAGTPTQASGGQNLPPIVLSHQSSMIMAQPSPSNQHTSTQIQGVLTSPNTSRSQSFFVNQLSNFSMQDPTLIGKGEKQSQQPIVINDNPGEFINGLLLREFS